MSTREICFDTETTGLDPKSGDRIIELGCVELLNLVPTGKVFHTCINPERSVSEATIRITGLTDQKLRDKPVFADPAVIDGLLEFLGDAPIIAHNAEFDRGFLNAELERCGRALCPKDRFIDTLVLARTRFPGQSNSLDALCRRFGISLEGRELHGALKDARLLASVYLELRGGRERMLDLSVSEETVLDEKNLIRQPVPDRPNALPERLTAQHIEAHRQFVGTLGKTAVWTLYAQT